MVELVVGGCRVSQGDMGRKKSATNLSKKDLKR